MNHLFRELAPISERAWGVVDDEARASLERFLAARRVVDFAGPHGWDYSVTSGGRLEGAGASEPVPGAHLRVRSAIRAVELHVAFTVARSELAAIDRGASNPDLAPLDSAAKRLAHAENHVVFDGAPGAGIAGIAEASPYPSIALEAGYDSYPRAVAWAVERLREAGIDGPYGIVLNPADYTGVVETTENGGYPVFDHVRKILGGPIVWGPGMEDALVVSLRGGDYVLDSGQDISIGYTSHDDENVNLYFEESFTFKVNEPNAAVTLKR